MTLSEICAEIAEIERKLDYGEITFSYDNLMCAMKPGHPVEILDDVLATIYYDVIAGKTPDIKKVKKTLSGLVSFQRTFKVDLKKPIKELKEYIKEVDN
jgi:hypothetical protein